MDEGLRRRCEQNAIAPQEGFLFVVRQLPELVGIWLFLVDRKVFRDPFANDSLKTKHPD